MTDPEQILLEAVETIAGPVPGDVSAAKLSWTHVYDCRQALAAYEKAKAMRETCELYVKNKAIIGEINVDGVVKIGVFISLLKQDIRKLWPLVTAEKIRVTFIEEADDETG